MHLSPIRPEKQGKREKETEMRTHTHTHMEQDDTVHHPEQAHYSPLSSQGIELKFDHRIIR